MTGAKEMAAVAETLCDTEIHETTYAEQGTFLPLGMWKAKGADTALIEASTCAADIRQHPQLGTCYRVSILTTGS